MSQGTSSGSEPQARTEMHRSLRIPEVVGMICSQLKPISWRSTAGKADLAVLARTSTVFHDAALDVLWSHQETLMNLIRCMPADLWEGLALSRNSALLDFLAFLGQAKIVRIINLYGIL